MTKQEWEFNHAACPNCGETKLKQTLVGVPEIDGQYEDNINTATCGCGWAGKVADLKPANTGQEKPMPIRLLDFQGETFANTKDVVTAMLDFNKKLNASLPRDDQRAFADAIFGEITKMMVKVDEQHWVNKYNYQAGLQAELAKKAKDDLDSMGPATEEKKEE